MKVDQETVNEIYELLIPKFDEIDKIMEELNIPKDLSKIIYSYTKPYCNDCDLCCSICKVFCYLGECRDYQRKICIKYAVENRLERFESKND